MSSFGVNELTQLRAYGCTVGGKATLQNAVVIGSQKFKSSPRISSEISSVGDFESVDYLWAEIHVQSQLLFCQSAFDANSVCTRFSSCFKAGTWLFCLFPFQFNLACPSSLNTIRQVLQCVGFMQTFHLSFSVTGFRITQKAVSSLFTLLAGKFCPSAIQSNGHPMSVYRSMIFKHFSRYAHCSLPQSSSFLECID